MISSRLGIHPGTAAGRSGLIGIATALLILLAPGATAAQNIIIQNDDAPGEGLNDPTAAAPVGGNTATTRGAQRLAAFNQGAQVVASRLQLTVDVVVSAEFDPLDCDENGAVLGAAGPRVVYRLEDDVYYTAAQANHIRGYDLSPGNHEINAQFNADYGVSCPTANTQNGNGWYYGLDGNPGSGQIDFVTIVSHEILHGLGFLSLVDPSTGAKFNGYDDAYMRLLEDGSTGTTWSVMTDAERQASATDTGDLLWTGSSVTSVAGSFFAGVSGGLVQMFAPATLQGGSSVSHFDTAASPNQLMEPYYTGPDQNLGAAAELLSDLGWTIVGDCAAPNCDYCTGNTCSGCSSGYILDSGGTCGTTCPEGEEGVVDQDVQCQIISGCGDGIVDSNEECDDNNQQDRDGCSRRCQTEESQDADQQKCLALQLSYLGKAAKTQGNENRLCIKTDGKAKLEPMSAEECLSADRKNKILKLKVKLVQSQSDPDKGRCLVAPEFGYKAGDGLIDAVTPEGIEFLHESLASATDLAATIVDATQPENKGLALCQATLLKASDKILDTYIKNFATCAKKGLRAKLAGDRIVSAATLESCWGYGADKIIKAVEKHALLNGKKCADKGADWRDAVAGDCRNAGNEEDFASCVQRLAACRSCRMLNGGLELGMNCDLSDDALANSSCTNE